MDVTTDMGTDKLTFNSTENPSLNFNDVGAGSLPTDNAAFNSTKNPPFEFSDYTQRVIVAILFLSVAVLGIFGNTLVILAVLLSRKVRTATNAFVVNLSVADLLTCLVIPWNAVALLGREGLPVGVWVCSVTAVVQNAAVGCSVFSLVFIGLNRLLLITRPRTTYYKIYTPKKIVVWLVLVWLIPLFITLLPSLMNIGGFTYNKKYHTCGSTTSQTSSHIYNIIVGGVVYPILLIIIIACYLLIWRHLKHHTKKMANAQQIEATPSIPSTISMGYTGSDDMKLSHVNQKSLKADNSQLGRRQSAITKNMFFVVCAFMLCVTPYAVVAMYGDSPARPYLFALFFFNSCVNPIIYGTKHRDFKAIFRYILRRQWANIPEPSGFFKVLRRSKCCWVSDQSG